MNVQEIMERLGSELVKLLVQADSAEELAKMAQEQNAVRSHSHFPARPTFN